ncbi:DUF2235 domain-containing protein [Ensifer sp. ENS04]|uniref:DUF2235 domain-containing protein n=1 Tax=Ensifer sp. ENS04 TaxID=2769281 RepID=UPI0017838031|nr:DUF2235 domain-containing protein [Ensifer sp. ENS04]MBD9541291.1 DUF2235 domain-containing protein [Ensifer sp. ENS04]
MPKNVVIFSDGTGQAGGLFPDERRSNVYKLYRAARCGPDSRVDPDKQIAFYDAGLGSASDAEDVKIGFVRKVYNVLSQATGLGITTNIIDCYTAILQSWEPGDRIFLFGFSRGAYTARCVGGVLGLCGVPTTMPDGSPLKRDARAARKIATIAVTSVYQHGAGRRDERFTKQRAELAQDFRRAYNCNNSDNVANAVPYFIGVWDTVGALGISLAQQILVFIAALLLAFAASAALWALVPWDVGFVNWIVASVLATAGLFVIWYVGTHLKFARGLSDPWWKTLHLTGWRMRFYDTYLNPRVEHAKHALSIDENRATLERVGWTPRTIEIEGREAAWFEQVWFAGVHSDVGGSYLESESRLSDVSLKWMVDKALAARHPLIVETNWLNLFPSAKGMQHDERKSGRLPWKMGTRKIPNDAPLHPTVLERFELEAVLHFDEVRNYRPEALRHHSAVAKYYLQPSDDGNIGAAGTEAKRPVETA